MTPTVQARDYTLRIWRQPHSQALGRLVLYQVHRIVPDMSLLEMLDELNQELLAQGQDPVAFDQACQEGLCGACALVINGRPHTSLVNTAACRLRMHSFPGGDPITIEPWRTPSYSIRKDLSCDRSAFSALAQGPGYVSSKPPDRRPLAGRTG